MYDYVAIQLFDLRHSQSRLLSLSLSSCIVIPFVSISQPSGLMARLVAEFAFHTSVCISHLDNKRWCETGLLLNPVSAAHLLVAW